MRRRTLARGTRLFGANQLSYEHRYFAASRPVPADWSKLDIQQAADDAHRIVEAFRWIYPGPWVNTGISKGGMASVYHRRFYPCDVDATVAYSAPVSLGTSDPAYPPFLEQVGGAPWQACRTALIDFQRRLLSQRDQLTPRVQGTFTRVPIDKAFELAVIELFVAFWQYTAPDDPGYGCAAIPAPGALAAEMLAFLEYHSSPDLLAGDQSLALYEPYYFQAAAQLGAPKPYEAPLSDLL
ncbi:MAG: S28 family serine protease, partial [Myxococcaceae bacterium]